jgi:hypothetical protein
MNKFQHLIERYNIPGIEQFIEGAIEIFPGQPPSYIEHFVNSIVPRIKHNPPTINIGVVFGMAKHHKNLADNNFAIGDWKRYIDHTIISAKLKAIGFVLAKKERDSSPDFDIEKIQNSGI